MSSIEIKEGDTVLITATSWKGATGKVLLCATRLPVKRAAKRTHFRGEKGQTEPGVKVLIAKGSMRKEMWFFLRDIELVVPEIEETP
jgi:hypothetical protein